MDAQTKELQDLYQALILLQRLMSIKIILVHIFNILRLLRIILQFVMQRGKEQSMEMLKTFCTSKLAMEEASFFPAKEKFYFL